MLFTTPKIIRQIKGFPRETTLGTQLLKSSLVLLTILSLHVVLMMCLEGMSFGDAVWLTMTSAATVGYGDLAAKTTWGRVATIVLIYLAGIAFLTQVVGFYFEYRGEKKRRMLKGDWSWRMENHLVLLNSPDEQAEEYFYQVILSLRKSRSFLSQAPVVLVNKDFKEGLSSRLRKMDVVHVHGEVFEKESLLAANVKKAATIALICRNSLDHASDGLTFDLVDRLREMDISSRIVAEVVDDENRERIQRVGANSVLRPIRAYPELLLRTIVTPGAERIIETLFDSKGEECLRYSVRVSATWRDIVRLMIDEDWGTPIALERENGEFLNHPRSKEYVDTRAIFVIGHEEAYHSEADVQALFEKRFPKQNQKGE